MAKNFVLQLGSLVALFVSIPAFIALLFGIINIQFPDAADSYWQVESAGNAIRYSIAVLVIFFPAYLTLTRMVNNSRRGEGQKYHIVTKWLIYLALLVGGLVMLIDLAVVVFTFLNGEITTRFILKAVALLAVIAAAFYYYLLDARDHWQKKEKISVLIGLVTLAIVLVSVVVGYLRIEAPSVVREIKIDNEQLNDLRDMQWRVEEFYQVNGLLPDGLEDIFQDLPTPTAPENRESYGYRKTGSDTYELCATFSQPTPESERGSYKYAVDSSMLYQNQNWDHIAGRKCFERKAVKPE